MSLVAGFEHVTRENEPLSPYVSLRLGGVAEYFAEPTTIDELQAIVHRFANEGTPIRLIGGGSNILVRDEGTPGLVIHLSAPAFGDISIDDNRIKAGGGAKLSHFISTAVREGLAGVEELVGIPGSIGGALHGNTGTHTEDIGGHVQQATVLTRKGEIVTRTRDEMSFSYRESSLNELVILEAEFEYPREDSAALTRRLQKLWIMRKAQQPLSTENSVYVFKDQGGVTASQLLDQAGLKGTRIGDVEISSRDPNFFVAGPKATSDDVLRLIDLARTQVAERLSVDLETGLQIW